MLKSWILFLQDEFDGTHSLQSLRQSLIQCGVKFPFTKEENKVLDHISRLYELRYPNRIKPTEMGEEELILGEQIVEKIFRFLPDELVAAFEAIQYGHKGGRVLMAIEKDRPIDVKLILDK